MPAAASSFTLSVSLGQASFSASGKTDQVLKAFEDFKVLSGHAGVSAPATPAGTKQTKAKPLTHTGGGQLDKLPLPAFLDQHKLKGNPEIATAILSWTALHENKPKVTVGELKTLWAGTNNKAPKNIPRDLKLAIRKGWITAEGKGKDILYSAPVYGQNQVANWAADEE